jgi:hypothetical protein
MRGVRGRRTTQILEHIAMAESRKVLANFFGDATEAKAALARLEGPRLAK